MMEYELNYIMHGNKLYINVIHNNTLYFWSQKKQYSTLNDSKLLKKLEKKTTKYNYTNNGDNMTVDIDDNDKIILKKHTNYSLISTHQATNKRINSKINELFGKYVLTLHGFVCQVVNKAGQFFTGTMFNGAFFDTLFDDSKLEIVEHVDFNETIIKIVVNNNNQKLNIITMSDNMGIKNKAYNTFMRWYNGINNTEKEEVVIKPNVIKEITFDMMDMIFDMNLECVNKS